MTQHTNTVYAYLKRARARRTQAEIVEETGLAKRTVGVALRELAAAGQVQLAEPKLTGRRGRPARQYVAA